MHLYLNMIPAGAPTGNYKFMVKGQFEKGVLFDSRALLHTLALFCLVIR